MFKTKQRNLGIKTNGRCEKASTSKTKSHDGYKLKQTKWIEGLFYLCVGKSNILDINSLPTFYRVNKISNKI